MDVLFISGVADDNQVKAVMDSNGQFQYLLNGSSSVSPAMEGSKEFKTRRFILAGNSGNQRYAFSFKPAVIFNEISDADTHKQSLSRCISFCKQQGVPVINSPEAINRTRRDQVAAELSGIKDLIFPKTVRFIPKTPSDVSEQYESNFKGPVLLRQAGLHGGKRLIHISNINEIEKALYAFALDGRPYYMSSFEDYSDERGLYKKYRIVIVDGVPYLRHVLVDEHWMVHRRSRQFMTKHPDLQEEERYLIANFHKELAPKISHVTQNIASKLKLDYFGIDCHIGKDNKILVFEANANMNILINLDPTPNIWESPIAAIKEHLKALIQVNSCQPEI